MTKKLYLVAKDAADFLEKHHPQAQEWGNSVEWCAWYISNGFMCALHRPADGSICALAAARPVNHPDDGNIPYKHDNGGKCIFIDFLAIEDHDSPAIFPSLTTVLEQRFGQREQIAFQRVKVLDFSAFIRNIGRVKKIGVPSYVTTKTPNPA